MLSRLEQNLIKAIFMRVDKTFLVWPYYIQNLLVCDKDSLKCRKNSLNGMFWV